MRHEMHRFRAFRWVRSGRRAIFTLACAALALCTLAAAGENPGADPKPILLPHRIYEYLNPGTTLITVNGIDFTADTYIEAALTQLPAADKTAMIQAAQIVEELRSRNLAVTDAEIDSAADDFAATVNASRPDQPKLTADQLVNVMGIERSMFKRYIARFAGLRKLLIADNQITADVPITDPRFQAAGDSYLKLLQIKYPPKAGSGNQYLQVGRQAISKAEAIDQYRSSVWSRGYRNSKAEDIRARTDAAIDALNNDVLSIVDRILRYKVVYARWHALGKDMTAEFKDQVLRDITDALAFKRGDLGSPESMFTQFLRQRNTTREAFLQSYEFEMTCMLSMLVADQLEEPVLQAAFNKDPQAYGKGDPIVRMIFVPTQDADGADLPRTVPTGLTTVDDAYEKLRRVASNRARETLRLAEVLLDEKGFAAAAHEFNKDPLTQSTDGLIGRVPPTAKDARFTPAMMAEIKRLSEQPPRTRGKAVEGDDGWYLFQVDSIENPTFKSVYRRVFIDVIGRERVKLLDQLMHTAQIGGDFGPAYRLYLDADWKSKYETPDLPAGGPRP